MTGANPEADFFFFFFSNEINLDNKAFLTGVQIEDGNGCTDRNA